MVLKETVTFTKYPVDPYNDPHIEFLYKYLLFCLVLGASARLPRRKNLPNEKFYLFLLLFFMFVNNL